MTGFKKKQKGGNWQKRVIMIIVGIIMVVLLFIMVIADMNMFQKKRELNYQISSLNQKIAEAKQSNANLQQGIEEADNVAYIERVAREQLGLQKSGEKVVSFIPAAEPEQIGSVAPKHFWQAWLGWVANIVQ